MRRVFFIIFLILPLLFAKPLFAQYAQPHQNDEVILPKTEVINKDFFASGKKVQIDGTINGDAYVAGGDVVINGDVNGDVLAAGGNVTIKGNVSDNVRIAGGNIIVSGSVGHNITAMGGNITLDKDATLSGSLVTAGGDIVVNAPIAKGITVAAGRATIANTVGGDILAAVNDFSISKEAHVAGNVTYFSDNQAAITDQATVSGTISQQFPQNPTQTEVKQTVAHIVSIGKLISFLFTLLFGFLIIRFFPVLTRIIADQAINHPVSSFLVGFISVFIFPVLLFLMVITLVGIPFAIICAFLFFLLLYVGNIFVSFVVGEKILLLLNQKSGPYLTYFAGLLLYTFLTMLPIVGWIISFVGFFTGVGAVLVGKKTFYKTLREKMLI